MMLTEKLVGQAQIGSNNKTSNNFLNIFKLFEPHQTMVEGLFILRRVSSLDFWPYGLIARPITEREELSK